jgi:hypothetical protein
MLEDRGEEVDLVFLCANHVHIYKMKHHGMHFLVETYVY